MKKRRILLAGMLLTSATLLAGCNIHFNSLRYNVDFYIDGELYKSVGTDGKTVEMPANPTKEGYQFKGWYTEENGKGELITFYTLLNQPLSEDVRLNIYAYFLEELTVSYVTGTDEVIADAIYVEGDTMSALTPTVTPEDMVFGGWFTDENCTEKWNEDAELSKDLTLYAGWLTKAVTVTYVYNMEGMEDTTVQATRFTTTEAVTPNSTEEETFVGWYKDEALTEEWNFTDTVDDNLTLYAKWDSKYAVITYDFQHESLENKTVKVLKGATAENIVPDTIPPYHDFLGWTKYSHGGLKWDFNTPIEQNTTLYADWDDHTGEYVRVTYVDPDGYSYYNSTKIGSLIPSRDPYLPQGQRFVGWFLDEDFTKPWDIENDLADKNEITLYGKAETVYYNITFDTQGLATIPPTTLPLNGSMTLPVLSKENHYLKCWVGTIKETGDTFTVESWEDFEFTLFQESDIHFTPEFESIFQFEKIQGKEEYTLKKLHALAQTEVVIPSTYEGLPVTQIAKDASHNINIYKKLTIPDSVTLIGEDAFTACYDLQEVVIGSGVTTIEYGAFSDCRALKKVTFTGNALKTVESDVFFNTAIESLTFPDSVESIGSLSYMKNLSYVYLGKVKTLTGSFYDCTALKMIQLPITLESVKENIFDGCHLIIFAEAASKPDGWAENWNQQNLPVVWNASNVKTFTLNNMLFATSGEKAILLRYDGNGTDLTVPETVMFDGQSYPVTEIAPHAFYLKDSLVNLSLPNTLEKVNHPQFIGCNALQYHVEDGVSYLGNAENPYLLLKDLTANQEVLTIRKETRIILGHSPNHYYSKTYYIGGLEFEEGSDLQQIGPLFYNWYYEANQHIFLPEGVKYISAGAFNGSKTAIFVPEESAPNGWAHGWFNSACAVYYGSTKENIATVNEATYLLQGDEATLLKLENTTDTYVLPDSLTVNGNEYTLTAVAKLSLSYTKADLVYLAIPETVTSIDFTLDYLPKFQINAYLVGSNDVPEGYNPYNTTTFYGVTEDDYIIDENAHFIVFGDYAMAYKFTGQGTSSNPTVYALPKTVNAGGSDLPVSHISRYFIASAQYVSMLFQDTVAYIPQGKTYGYGAKFFTTHSSQPAGWETGWNEAYGGGSDKSYIPVTYGVKGFTEEIKTYSFVTNGTAVATITAAFIPTEPTTTLQNKNFWGWYDNEEFNGEAVEFPYTGASATLYARFEDGRRQDGKSQDTAFEVTLGSYMPVNIKTPGQVVYFRLDVTAEQTYLFKSRGDCDTVGRIYYLRNTISLNKEETVATADGGGNGENFSVSEKLLKRTYYFTVKLSETSQTGSFEILISVA